MSDLSFAKHRSKHQIEPTIELNQKIAGKKNVIVSLSLLFLAMELICLTALFYSLYYFRIYHEYRVHFAIWELPGIRKYAIFFTVSSGVFMLFVYRYGIYYFRSASGVADELYKLVKAYSFAILITIGVGFLLKLADISRLVIVSYWLSAILSSSVLRYIRRQTFYHLAKRGAVSKNVIIIGAGKIGKSLMDELLQSKWLGYKVIGFLDDQDANDYKELPFLGSIDRIKDVLHRHLVDELIITIPSQREMVNGMINDLRKLNIKITIIPDMFNLVMSTVKIETINELPAVTLVKTPMRGIGLLAKRTIDIISSAIIILIVSPVLAFAMLSIKLDSKGPIFYKQKRLGKNGHYFNMYKFRSMRTDADQLLKQLVRYNEMDGHAFKMKNDPRVTSVGKWLRKYSIDELPQLFNVLKGDMSLVGPRPPLPNEVERYGHYEWRRLEVLPGMTGLWQVSGRSNLTFKQWMDLDVYYIENWSLGLDFKILLKTIPVVAKGEGAY